MSLRLGSATGFHTWLPRKRIFSPVVQANGHSITPARPRALTRSKRKHIESRIKELIAVLDEADGDCDLEENGDLEPSLGGPCGLKNYDAEHDDSDLEPDIEDDRESRY